MFLVHYGSSEDPRFERMGVRERFRQKEMEETIPTNQKLHRLLEWYWTSKSVTISLVTKRLLRLFKDCVPHIKTFSFWNTLHGIFIECFLIEVQQPFLTTIVVDQYGYRFTHINYKTRNIIYQSIRKFWACLCLFYVYFYVFVFINLLQYESRSKRIRRVLDL